MSCEGSQWVQRDEESSREDEKQQRLRPALVTQSSSLSKLLQIQETRRVAQKTIFCEANGNGIRIQETKSETGKGGSHFLKEIMQYFGESFVDGKKKVSSSLVMS